MESSAVASSGSKFPVIVEIWQVSMLCDYSYSKFLTDSYQAQNYWPLKGWTAPISGGAHFSSCLLPPQGADLFPDELAAPSG